MIFTDFAPNEDRSDALKALSLCAEPQTWFSGSAHTQVAKNLATYFPDHQSTLFLTARAALYSYLKALNLPAESDVLVTGFTCKAVIIPIKELRLNPVFVDIDTQTYSMNPIELKKRLTSKSRLIILQHTFGIPPHRREIIELAAKHNIPVLEDIAHGFDERLFKKDKHKTDKLLSFGRTKVLSSLFGGAIATPNKHLHVALQQIEANLTYPTRSFLLSCLMYKPLNLFMRNTYGMGFGKAAHHLTNIIRLFPKELSRPETALKFDPYVLKKYPNALAVLLLHQMKKFEYMQSTRRRISSYYSAARGGAFNDLPLNRFPLLVNDCDTVRRRLMKKGIYLGRWYREVLPPKGECPVTEHVSAHILNLPTLISQNDAERVVNEIDLKNIS